VFGPDLNTKAGGSLFSRNVSFNPQTLYRVQIPEDYNLKNLHLEDLENYISDETA
jgi:hypothetical protein